MKDQKESALQAANFNGMTKILERLIHQKKLEKAFGAHIQT